jgi:hypothetical protein
MNTLLIAGRLDSAARAAWPALAVSAALAALILLPLAAACPVRAHVSIHWENDVFQKNIYLTYWGRPFYRFANRRREQKEKASLGRLREIFKEEICRIALEKLEIKVAVNAGDPCATAMAAGVLWGIVPSAASWFAKNFDARYLKPDLRVQPEYSGEPRWELTADCILSASLDHIIFVLQRWICHRIQNKFRRCAHERSSH